MLRPFIAAIAFLAVCPGVAHAQYTSPVRNSGFYDGSLNWYALGGIGANGEDSGWMRIFRNARRWLG